jgi:hypothetical protein
VTAPQGLKSHGFPILAEGVNSLPAASTVLHRWDTALAQFSVFYVCIFAQEVTNTHAAVLTQVLSQSALFGVLPRSTRRAKTKARNSLHCWFHSMLSKQTYRQSSRFLTVCLLAMRVGTGNEVVDGTVPERTGLLRMPPYHRMNPCGLRRHENRSMSRGEDNGCSLICFPLPPPGR